MRELEHKMEENRMKRDEEEKNLQKVIDTLRSTHSKLDSEKDLKENEVTEIRKEVNKIKLDIMQVVYIFLECTVIFTYNLFKVFTISLVQE